VPVEVATTDTTPTDAAPAETVPVQTRAASSQDLDIAISSLELINADIAFHDMAAEATYHLHKFNFKGDNLKPGGTFHLGATGLLVATKEFLSAGFQMNASGQVNLQNLTGKLSSLNLVVSAEGKGIPGGRARLDFNGALDASQGIALIGLTINNLKAEGFNASLSLDGTAEIPLNYRQTRLNIHRLEAVGLDSNLSFRGNITPLAMQGTGEINANISPKNILAALGSTLNTQNPHALESLEFSSPIELTPELGINLASLHGRLDETKFAGNLAINPGEAMGGQGNDLGINSVLKMDVINLDDYLSPAGGSPVKRSDAQKSDSTTSGHAGGKSDQDSTLKTLQAKVEFDIDELTATKIILSNFKGMLTIKDGTVALSPCFFTAFNGQVDLAAKATPAQTPMPLTLNFNAKNMALGEVMQFFSGEQKITGNTDLTLNVTGAGNTWAAISKTLAGSGALSVSDGVISKIRLLPESATSVGMAGIAPLRPLDGRLESLTATFQGTNGRFTNNDLSAITSIASVTGSGWVNLGQNSINYEFLVNADSYTIPILVTGSLSAPRTGLNAEKFLTDNAAQLLKDGKSITSIVTDPTRALQNVGEAMGLGGSRSGDEASSGDNENRSLRDNLRERTGDALRGLF
jgi:uncharacterized protein involved in outer membrane biogenesis